MKKVQTELDEQVGKDRVVNESDMTKLVYLQAVIKESLRLTPTTELLVPRETMKDCVVAGRHTVIVNARKLQHDPKVWPEPTEFGTERFLDSHAAGIDVKGQNYELIPFGTGRRSCAGISMALHVMKLTLARLTQGFELSPVGDLTPAMVGLGSDSATFMGDGEARRTMTVFHFFNCAILTFGPHVVYYSATPLSEYDTVGTSVKAAVVYLATALVKLVCLATFLKVPENDNFDPYQELLKAMIGFIDVAGLYFALTQLTHRNISQNHKFQAVGLGWAFADSVLHRLAPLWIGARGLEFTWEYIFQGLEANANLVLNLSLAALGSLMWLRKNKPKTLIPIIYAFAGILATMPSITSYLSRGLGWHFPEVVGFELISSLVMAFFSWQLFSACQKPST
ncbi:hypothetical protein J5N97_000954 [Dioscorea zingiberensis]|uniref:BOS complex subunit TMEM147 n=1 Tax=Dioscorea zingiberensis TaxID=325984 RepID=A0A9D5H2N2_9LILI|nr:hypothetical protein J5N97_000954 [Dioscorea zingiberensis]